MSLGFMVPEVLGWGVDLGTWRGRAWGGRGCWHWEQDQTPVPPLWLRLVPRLAWDHHWWDRPVTRDATGFGVGAPHRGLRWRLAGKIGEQSLSPETLEPCFPGPRNCSIPQPPGQVALTGPGATWTQRQRDATGGAGFPEAGPGPPAGQLRMESFRERNVCGVAGRCIPRQRPVSRTLICTN